MRIPLTNFGNEVPRAVQTRTPSAQELDGGLTHAAAGLGNTMTNVALQGMQDQASADEMDRRQRVHDIMEQNRIREAADRAKAGERIAQGRDALDALHENFAADIQTGQIDKTKALDEYRKQAGKLITDMGEGVPDAYTSHVQNDLQLRANRLEGKVVRAVTQRDRSDIAASIDTTLEYAQRLATTDQAKGQKVGMDALDQLGPFAGMAPDVIAKKKQAFTEGVAYTRAYTAIMTARTDNGSLKAADKAIAADDQMDPQKKAQLLNTSAGFQAANEQRAEAAAARLQRQSEANLKRAEAEFNVFQTLADKGGALDPEYVARVSAKTAGTPYQAGIKALADQAVSQGGIAQQPIAAQRQALTDIDAKINANGRSPELDHRRSQVEKVLRASEADLKADPMKAALERGIVTKLEPLNMSSPAAMAGSLQLRVEQSRSVAVWAGQAVSPLTADEADQLQGGLSKLPPKERSQAVAVVSQAMGPQQAIGLAKQLDSKDKALALAFASGSTATSQGRYVSELILAGSAAQKDGTSTKGEKVPGVKASQWKANIAEQLRGVFPAQTLTDHTMEAALYIAHGMASEQGGDLSERNLKTAVNLAVGGQVAEINGRKVALPVGIEPGALETRLQTITATEIQAQSGPTVRAGGVDVPVADFVKHLPGAQLQSAGRGRYMVIVEGRPVVNPSGKPVLIDVK